MIILPNGTIVLDGNDVDKLTIESLCNEVKCGRFIRRKPQKPARGVQVEESSDEERSDSVVKDEIVGEEELDNGNDLRYTLTPEEVVYCLNRFPKLELKFEWKEYFSKFIQPHQLMQHRTFVYRYYKESGWIIRSGCKFGCDFLLYRKGPELDHSMYTVQIVTKQNNFDVLETLAACRTSKQVKKTALFVLIQSDLYSVECYEQFSFKPAEFTLSRWKPI